jgi:DNA-binding LacI/PurR family transcriptional regulator
LTVTGFGGVPEGETVSPTLTTVKVPLLGMGAAAVRRIIERQKADAAVAMHNYHMVFPGLLVERESHRAVK